MNPLVIGPLFSAFDKVFDRLFPDPEKKAQAQLEVMKMQQAGEFKEMDQAFEINKAQIDVNNTEAASTDPFTSRWRPFIGWVCGVGLGIQFIVNPLATWVAALVGHAIQFPSLDLGTLMTLLFGMLGLGGLRTMEKIKGTK